MEPEKAGKYVLISPHLKIGDSLDSISHFLALSQHPPTHRQSHVKESCCHHFGGQYIGIYSIHQWLTLSFTLFNFLLYIHMYIFFFISLSCIFYHTFLRLPALISMQFVCMQVGHRFISLPSSFQQHTNKYVFCWLNSLPLTNVARQTLPNSVYRMLLDN